MLIGRDMSVRRSPTVPLQSLPLPSLILVIHSYMQ